MAKILPRKAGRSDGFSPICMVTCVIGARAARTVEWLRTAARGSKASAPNARKMGSMDSPMKIQPTNRALRLHASISGFFLARSEARK